MSTNLRPRLYWLMAVLGVLLIGLGTYQVMAQDSVEGEVELTGILEQVGDGFSVVSGQTISIVNGQAVAHEVEFVVGDDDFPANCTPVRPTGWVTYIIQANDTLSGIAARTGSHIQELVRVNCITNRRLIATGAEIFVPLPIDDDNPTERCRLAGLEPERCRVLLFGDDDAIAERCRLADIELERCRALFGDDDNNVAERCRLAGIEPERCRALVFGDEDNLTERCRLAGFEPERCRVLLFGGNDDDNSGPGSDNSGHGGDDSSGSQDGGDDNGRGRDHADDNSSGQGNEDHSGDDSSGSGRGGQGDDDDGSGSGDD